MPQPDLNDAEADKVIKNLVGIAYTHRHFGSAMSGAIATIQRLALANKNKAALTPEAIKHLQFIYDRMETHHEENPDMDFMRRFKEILVRAKENAYLHAPSFSFISDCGTKFGETLHPDGTVTPWRNAGELGVATHGAVSTPEWATSTDAQVWAKNFVEHVLHDPTIPMDEGCMIGWFANAMMAMHDHTVRNGVSFPSPTEREEYLKKLLSTERQTTDTLEQANIKLRESLSQRAQQVQGLMRERDDLSARLEESTLPAGMASTKPESEKLNVEERRVIIKQISNHLGELLGELLDR